MHIFGDYTDVGRQVQRVDDLAISRLLNGADLHEYALDGNRPSWPRKTQVAVLWADTCFKLFIDLSVSCFDATPTTGLVERASGQKLA